MVLCVEACPKKMRNVVCSFLMAASAMLPLLAQNGDGKGENQPSRVPARLIPPSPPLSPEEALKKFKIANGFEIQTAAHEPDVEAPIALQFDPEGRIWVLEMRGFMPNAQGIGEDKPVGRVSILEDSDGDGVAEKARVFLDGLVMPRAFLLVHDGLLLAEPPKLWFYPIRNDKPGERVLVDDDYAKEADPKLGTKANPEHSANSLTLALDNWIYSMDHTRRYRFADGNWIKESNPKRAQFGMSQDNYGRLFYSANSDQLRGDLVPSHYVLKAGLTAKLPGLGVQIAKEQFVWPTRVNPGVNRGYQPGTLRPFDYTLEKFTAACGTSIYRGDALTPDCVGNAFLCEPAANVVRRNILTEKDAMVTARNAYEKAEFLASTDELFRPVNTYTGPEGALYIVDMYHGIIQHRVFLTSYLRKQAESRGLDKVTAYGRIYRVTHQSKKSSAKPRLSKASVTELANELGHPNGWRRDTAQRLMLERNDPLCVPLLLKMVANHPEHLARLHALWTLEGLKRIDTPVLMQALEDKHPKVRAAAVRIAEAELRTATSETAELRKKVLSLSRDESADVQAQIALTLGEITADEESRAVLKSLTQSKFVLAKDAATFSTNAREAKPVAQTKPRGPKLSLAEMKRFEAGKANYETVCLPCHQPHGMGQEGLAPPLVGSEWVSGSEQRLARIVLNGLRGPIKVKGQPFELDMPALGILEDEQIATILTYIRNEWGHSYPPVTSETVKKARDATAERGDAWTQEELLKIR
jgi:mono/diheme cytochrome c family protein/glucose/arabinose dehydrogenase